MNDFTGRRSNLVGHLSTEVVGCVLLASRSGMSSVSLVRNEIGLG